MVEKKRVVLQQAHHIDMSEVNPSLISLLLLKMERGNRGRERCISKGEEMESPKEKERISGFF